MHYLSIAFHLISSHFCFFLLSEAYDRYAEFECVLTSEVRRYYEPLITAIGNWHEEIFSYFDKPITNAYTESLNSVIRHIDRIGRGHSFETIRAKVIEASREKKASLWEAKGSKGAV
jgi:Transposase